MIDKHEWGKKQTYRNGARGAHYKIPKKLLSIKNPNIIWELLRNVGEGYSKATLEKELMTLIGVIQKLACLTLKEEIVSHNQQRL